MTVAAATAFLGITGGLWTMMFGAMWYITIKG